MQGQTLFHSTFLAMSECSARKTTKKVSDQTYLDNFKHWKGYLLEIDMIQREQDVA